MKEQPIEKEIVQKEIVEKEVNNIVLPMAFKIIGFLITILLTIVTWKISELNDTIKDFASQVQAQQVLNAQVDKDLAYIKQKEIDQDKRLNEIEFKPYAKNEEYYTIPKRKPVK